MPKVIVKSLFMATGETLTLTEEAEGDVYVLTRNSDEDFLSSFSRSELAELSQLIRALEDNDRTAP